MSFREDELRHELDDIDELIYLSKRLQRKYPKVEESLEVGVHSLKQIRSEVVKKLVEEKLKNEFKERD